MHTTIQLLEKTKEKLDGFKHYRRESYDEVVTKLIQLAEEDTLEYNKETKEGLARAKEDIKKRRVSTTQQLLKELGY